MRVTVVMSTCLQALGPPQR